MGLDLLYVRPHGNGWGPVDALVRLTTSLLDARLIELPERSSISAARRAASLIPRLPSVSGRKLLIIAPNPAHLAQAATARFWLPGYETTAAWVIDSFWTERVARFARGGSHLDRVFITDPGLVAEWSELTDATVSLLPWGADTLAFPLQGEDRATDLLRVGRQPHPWDDDDETARLAHSHGLRFEGRPPMPAGDPSGGYDQLRESLLRARCVLAFSNLHSPAAYTHPTRGYLTGRWTDALAAGALVVGAAPSSAPELLWDGATAEISPSDPDQGLARVAELCAQWTPQDALAQQLQARRRLDWRHRLRELSQALELPESPDLAAQLQELGASS